MRGHQGADCGFDLPEFSGRDPRLPEDASAKGEGIGTGAGVVGEILGRHPPTGE